MQLGDRAGRESPTLEAPVRARRGLSAVIALVVFEKARRGIAPQGRDHSRPAAGGDTGCNGRRNLGDGVKEGTGLSMG